jgi:polyhydroxyalkanoate synthesis regulator phasin
MAKKKNQESQEVQSERFRQTVRDLVDAGELNPTEADNAFDKVMRRIQRPTTVPSVGCDG